MLFFGICSYSRRTESRNRFADLFQHYYRFFEAISDALVECKTEERERSFYQFLQEEGIDKIGAVGGEYYNSLDEYIKGLLEQYKKRDYDSKWYVKQEWRLDIWLNQKPLSSAVVNLFHRCEKQHKAVGIWGAGANGVSLL